MARRRGIGNASRAFVRNCGASAPSWLGSCRVAVGVVSRVAGVFDKLSPIVFNGSASLNKWRVPSGVG